MRYIGAAEFKAKCLKLFDELEAGGEAITVTKRGRAVAMLVPPTPEKEPEPATLFGCMKGTVLYADDDLSPAWDEPWNAEKGVVFNDEDQEREDLEQEARRRKDRAA